MAKKKMVRITQDMSWEAKKRAVEMAVFLGFQTVSYEFPAASLTEGIQVPESLTELKGLWKQEKPCDIPGDYIAASKHAKPVETFDFRKKKGLEQLFSIGTFLKDNNNDLLGDSLNFKIILPKECDTSELIAACNLAFRFGMETTAYEGGIVAEADYKGPYIEIKREKECRITMEEKAGEKGIVVAGDGVALEQFTSMFCECFPAFGKGQDLAFALQEMTDSFAMKNLDGQLAYLDSYAGREAKSTAYVSPEFLSETIKKQFGQTTFVDYKGIKEVYKKEYEIKWEVDAFRELLEAEIYPEIKAGDRVRIEGALSEAEELRKELKEEIDSRLADIGADEYNNSVLCAYKQGYSWIEESVIPQILKSPKCTDIEKIKIDFRPFLPEGITDWGDVDGATPSYNNISTDGESHWFDLPIRFLQELYPVEDLISDKLPVNRDQIFFDTIDEETQDTYRIHIYDKQGEIFSASFQVMTAERFYLDEFPEMGRVHPPTGYLKLYLNDVLYREIRIKTDTERIWDIYQTEVLPDCKRFVLDETDQKPYAHLQPFFSKLLLEISASEPDRKLKSREDLYSTLDALHEDIYFTGSDYFKNLGLKYAGTMIDAPGLILPVIKNGAGKPRFSVTLYRQEQKEPCIETDGKPITSRYNRKEIALYLKELRIDEGKLTGRIEIEGVDADLVKSYGCLLHQGMIARGGAFGNISRLLLSLNGEIVTAELPVYKEAEKTKNIEDIDILDHTLIGYEEYLRVIDELRLVPGILVYRTAVSYAGRDIYAVELLPLDKGYVSRTKQITRYPSVIINARHHANEVSGTNAAFMLIKKILTDPDYKAVVQKLNLVVVPMENVDGAAIHYELQEDNPNWKLHVARFNAVGKEFYNEYFHIDTIHTEAFGITRLWRKFLPDVMIDNHGVPSHEWEQPFSGYTAPSFKGFWLPRSLLYGYFWYVTDEEYKSNYAVNKELQDVIAEAVGADTEAASWNQEWMHQFKKYANDWMPKLFPATYYKDMINYWIPFAHEEDHRYPSIRFPWITSVAYTSEVADETAQGDYLNLCARTHMIHDLAALKMLNRCSKVYDESAEFEKDRISAVCIRQRPVVI